MKNKNIKRIDLLAGATNTTGEATLSDTLIETTGEPATAQAPTPDSGNLTPAPVTADNTSETAPALQEEPITIQVEPMAVDVDEANAALPDNGTGLPVDYMKNGLLEPGTNLLQPRYYKQDSKKNSAGIENRKKRYDSGII